jgi:hypothetical protein
MNEKENYSTTDFYTTAILVATKFEVVKITTEGPGNKVKRFHFEDTPELRQTIKDYLNGKLTGDFRTFKNSIETVKDMVHGG